MPNESPELARLRGRLLALREECRAIGEAPPRPPTLRAAAGGLLVSAVRRLMFWYTPPVRNSIEGLAGILDGAIQCIAGLENRAAGVESRASDLEKGLIGVANQQENRAVDLEKWLAEQAGMLNGGLQRTGRLEDATRELKDGLDALYAAGIREQVETLREERKHIAAMLEEERRCSIELENRLRDRADHFEQLYDERVSKDEDLALRLHKAEERLHVLKLEVLDRSRRLSQLLEEVRRKPAGELPRGAFEEEVRHDLDSLYLSFEDEFRGTREELLGRLREYLPVLQQAAAIPVLDIGCGRGEWLELLRQEGLEARGVDTNRLMVEECRGRQLAVEEAEALEYLGGLAEASLGAVTVFHLVEHLPFDRLVRLLDGIVRVLRPGGVAIFETPNPDNILVGARNFYFDPTHRNPVPSATLRFLVEARGLCQVEVLPRNPCDPCNLVPGQESDPLRARFNWLFYGPQDYAVIGRKV